MSIVQRLGLCWLVSQSAYEIAYWCCMPQPVWTVRYDEKKDGQPRPLESPTQREDREIWIRLDLRPPGGVLGDRSFIECRRLHDGALVRRLERHGLFRPAVVRDRSELVTVDDDFNENGDYLSNFDCYSPHSATPIWSLTLSNQWRIGYFGRRAYRETRTDNGLTVSVVDIAPGSTRKTFHIPGPPETNESFDYAISRDLTHIALEEWDDGRARPRGVLLYSLETGKQIARIIPKDAPPGWTNPFAGELAFSLDGRCLKFYWKPNGPEYREYLYDLQSGAISPYPVSPKVASTVEGELDARNGFSDVWIVFEKGKSVPWFSIQREGKIIAPWRRYPFPVVVSEHRDVNSDDIDVLPIQDRKEIVSVVSERRPTDVIPYSWRRMAPSWLVRPYGVATIRWHNWETNEWRLVATFDHYTQTLLHRDGLLTWSWPINGVSRLQSWKLPPTDPTGPAKAIAHSAAKLAWLLF